MQNIRQSDEYGKMMRKLGWEVINFKLLITNIKLLIFVRRFFLLGSFVKILRIDEPVPFKEIENIAKKVRAFKIHIQVNTTNNTNDHAERDQIPLSGMTNNANPTTSRSAGLRGTSDQLTKQLKDHGYKLAKSAYGPTKTILIDLTGKINEIFNRFSPEKRRAVRRAQKNNLDIKLSDNINQFINLRKIKHRPFGFLVTKETKSVWDAFFPGKKAKLLLAFKHHTDEPISGILLLFHENVAYYWMAASTEEGKKLFAPTLLIWEALKQSKQRKCTVFDFEGIVDERFSETKNWTGFSRFKQGFGGKEVILFPPYQKTFWPIL